MSMSAKKAVLRSIARLVAIVLLTTFLPQIALALPDPDNDPDLPIDDGVSILIAAGRTLNNGIFLKDQ